jgi:hypothetical protein
MPDTVCYAGVPAHLDGPLRAWLRGFLYPDLAERIAVQLRIATHGSQLREVLDAAGVHGDLVDRLSTGEQLLAAVDLALQLDDALDWEIRNCGIEPVPSELPPAVSATFNWSAVPTQWAGKRARTTDRLDRLLIDAGSAYAVIWSSPPRLRRRLDPVVDELLEQTITESPPTAGMRLRDARRHAYGLHPDPTAAYREAVRAVEEIACPLVLAKAAANNSASLGTVRNHLRDAPDKWQFVLLDKDGDGSVAPLVAMLDRLWTGQVSRHGGGQNSRDQTLAEAQAAVHLAATLVQFLGGGALARRNSS